MATDCWASVGPRCYGCLACHRDPCWMGRGGKDQRVVETNPNPVPHHYSCPLPQSLPHTLPCCRFQSRNSLQGTHSQPANFSQSFSQGQFPPNPLQSLYVTVNQRMGGWAESNPRDSVELSRKGHRKGNETNDAEASYMVPATLPVCTTVLLPPVANL